MGPSMATKLSFNFFLEKKVTQKCMPRIRWIGWYSFVHTHAFISTVS
jgi:hypothetical protein